MKLLSQILALYLPGTASLQIMVLLAVVIVFMKTEALHFTRSFQNICLKKKMWIMENDVWAIE